MSTKVKVNYEELQKLLYDIAKEFIYFETYTKNISNSLVSKEAWNSKAEKVFHNHINNELLPFINEFRLNVEKYISYIEKLILKYQKIDKY